MDTRLNTGIQEFVSVILPLRLEWEPCYKMTYCADTGIASDDSTEKVCVGDRVKVMFAGKEYTGVVSGTGVNPEVSEDRIRNIISVERQLSKINEKEIRLWRSVAEYYMCSVGEVYKAAYPSQKISSEESLAKKNERTERRWQAIREAALRRLESALARQEKNLKSLAGKKLNTEARLEKKLQLLGKARKDSAKEKYAIETGKLKNELATLSENLSAAENEIDRLSAELSSLLSCRQEPAPEGRNQGLTGHKIILTDAQSTALEAIEASFRDRKTVLLRGVTGSGKTEIYITLAEKTISSGRNILYLIPEIALGKQIEERLRDIFKDRLLVFHSGETSSRRAEVAARIHEICSSQKNTAGGKDGYIVLGTRSSLFLPHENLGLVIVDEEHDMSYKQDSPAPRYNGRDTAIMLASIHSCPVLLGSATPSLESIYNCKSGKYTLVELLQKYHGAEEAAVELIDTAAERKKRGMRGSLSLKLIFKIEETLRKEGQVIILRSRRSYSPVLQCVECGYVPKCRRCNVSLSYHKASDKEICHYCGYSVRHTGTCPECGGKMDGIGAGTQKIEEEIAALFPHARIARLDSDSAQDRKYESEVLRRFGNREIDILIGTQMVTKGFDFSGLALVAVIGADSLLAQQDFRADEKALQTLEQFRGRCGRRGEKGTLIIQTSQPGHPVYQQLLHDGAAVSADTLMQERKDFGYPPYCRIIGIYVKDSFEERSERAAMKICTRLSDGKFRFIGPYAPAVSRGEGRHIREIRVSLDKDSRLQSHKALLHKMISDLEKEENYYGHITVDVDPA